MGRPVALALLLSLPTALVLAPAAQAIDCTRTSTGLVPLDDLGAGSWNGTQGGLYPGGSNQRPLVHEVLGLVHGNLVVPRAASGAVDLAAGKIVFLSIGMSNTRNEFTQFVPLSNADPLKHPRVQAVNGAIGGQDARTIANASAPYWGNVDTLLAQAGASPAQVQAVWLKEAVAGPSGPALAHAAQLRTYLESIVGILQERFPNLHMVYLSSRIYAGYATTGLNPEPYAYASGFSVKWLIEGQLNGSLAIPEARLWLAWGPYLWADGTADPAGLAWLCTDFANDGTHPNSAGSRKVADLLLDFVHSDPTASAWYVGGGLLA